MALRTLLLCSTLTQGTNTPEGAEEKWDCQDLEREKGKSREVCINKKEKSQSEHQREEMKKEEPIRLLLELKG